MGERRKQITFDLNQALLKQNYPRKRANLRDDYYLKAYTDIKRYMLKNGFDWIQQSVYESRKPMSIPMLIAMMGTMSQKMPWLCASANDIVASDVISKKYNIKKLLQKAAERDRESAELIACDIDKVEDGFASREEPLGSLQDLINAAEKQKSAHNASPPRSWELDR